LFCLSRSILTRHTSLNKKTVNREEIHGFECNGSGAKNYFFLAAFFAEAFAAGFVAAFFTGALAGVSSAGDLVVAFTVAFLAGALATAFVAVALAAGFAGAFGVDLAEVVAAGFTVAFLAGALAAGCAADFLAATALVDAAFLDVAMVPSSWLFCDCCNQSKQNRQKNSPALFNVCREYKLHLL
jgi:hypothetical protein